MNQFTAPSTGWSHTHYLPATQQDIAELKREIAELRTQTPIQRGPELTPEIVKAVLPPLVREILATWKSSDFRRSRENSNFNEQLDTFFGLILSLDILTCSALARHLLAIHRVCFDPTFVPLCKPFYERCEGFIMNADDEWPAKCDAILKEWGLA